MKSIKIGNKIYSKRKEKEITQDYLASYLGVSKTAVSKWETDQSYPDIALLPVIASYFQISIDELIGYEAQMTKEDIGKFYQKICDDFVKLPIDEVFEELQITTKKYYSCYTLLAYIALLYINHLELIKDKEKIMETLRRTKDICNRVKTESKDLREQKRGEQLEILCYLSMNEPKKVIEILQSSEELSSNYLLANAYYADQQPIKAITTLQSDIYQEIGIIMNSFQLLLMLYANDTEKFDHTVEMILKLEADFELNKLNLGMTLPIYIAIFTGYANQGNKEKALGYLELYEKVVLNQMEDFALQGNEFFDHFDEFSQEVNDIDISIPRNVSVIKKSAISAVIDNPGLLCLQDEERYIRICDRLQKGMD